MSSGTYSRLNQTDKLVDAPMKCRRLLGKTTARLTSFQSSMESIGQRSHECVSSQSLSLRYRPLFRDFLAEFLGTFILMAFGTGAQSQYLLSQGKLATSISANCTWGIGVIMGVYVSGGVSGGHLNPAVSVALAVLGRLPWRKVPFYILAQCFGSLCACAVVYFVYLDALNHFDGGARHVEGMNATAAIWATYPQSYVSTWTALGDQIFSTALLLICVLGVSDPRNMSPSSGLFPISIGLIVMGLGMAFNLNCGNAMNPARDFIPRVFTIIAGWGSEPLNYRRYNWFWVNIVGPHFGAVLGALIYQIFIGMNWPPTSSCDVPIGYTQTEPGYTHIERGYIQTQSCYTQTENGYMQTEPRYTQTECGYIQTQPGYTQTECGYIQTQPGYTQNEPLSGMSRV